MTQVLIDRATLEQLIEAAECLMAWQVKNVKVWHNSAYDTMDMRLNQLRAALANAEPTKGPITNHIEMANKALRQAADHSYKIAMATRYARTLPKDTL